MKCFRVIKKTEKVAYCDLPLDLDVLEIERAKELFTSVLKDAQIEWNEIQVKKCGPDFKWYCILAFRTILVIEED